MEAVKKAADNITASKFQVKIDDNGTEKTMDLDYEYSKDDKHSMLSLASNLDGAIKELFGDGNGGIDHQKLTEGLKWGDASFREKAIKSLVNKAIAQMTEEFTKESMNANFGPNKRMPSTATTNKGNDLPFLKKNSGYGIPFDPEQFS